MKVIRAPRIRRQSRKQAVAAPDSHRPQARLRKSIGAAAMAIQNCEPVSKYCTMVSWVAWSGTGRPLLRM
jgi:hypothetical protein